jgi:proton-translocating NADH-quinone oxidoreductase chain L
MPICAILLLTAALLPLAGFIFLLFLGKRIGTPLSGYFATAIIGASFVCSILAMIQWYGNGSIAGQAWGFGKAPINLPLRWIPIGTAEHPQGIAQEIPGWLDVGIFIDSLTITMFSMITMVATLVHIFSIGYMREDGRFPRFFAYLGLFCFSMLGLVLGGTLLHILIFWELVGFCSYILIGFWYEKKTASNAAIKAFVTNRIGDVGFLIGIGILFYQLGNVSLPHLWISLGNAGSGLPIALADHTLFTSGWLTVMGIGLIFGAIGKSAQFPLHVWLADAMEGPTPVSALIHAATMVAAGVYLLARVFPILSPDAKMFIAVIGVVTMSMGALIALVQTDIKKVLAFSTLSQLGYMMLAMGVGSWVGGLFHLVTHAFFKALLFLGAGSVIQAARHEQEMPEFGGLIRKIPVTAVTFFVGVLAISGVHVGNYGLSGYYSKELILTQVGAFADMAIQAGHSRGYLLLFAVPVVVSFLTPFYMMRCWMMTFWGKPRRPELYENARERAVMWGPLVVLMVLAIFSGRTMSVQELLEGSVQEDTAYCKQFDAGFAGFDSVWPSALPEDRNADTRTDAPTPAELALAHGQQMVAEHVGYRGFASGLLLAALLYYRGPGLAGSLLKIAPIRWVRTWLYERMYFDELYFGVFVTTVTVASELVSWLDAVVIDRAVNATAAFARGSARLASSFDRAFIDGAVTGTGSIARRVGDAVRLPQTGRVRGYVTLMLTAAAMAAVVAVIVELSK